MKKHVESLLFGVWINDSEGLRSKLIEKKRSGFEMTGFRSGQSGKFFLGLPCGILKVHKILILDSSMVEHTAVNRGVVGSSPTRGAGYLMSVRESTIEC